MEQPSIYIYNLRIDEPVTSATDVLVALVSWYAWYRLRSYPSDRVMKLIQWFFLLMGTATFLGGTLGHAWVYYFGLWGKVPGWITSMVGIMLLERAFIFYSDDLLHRSTVRFFYWFNIVEILTFMGLAVGLQNFRFVEYHTAYGLLVVVFGFTLYNWKRGRRNPFLRHALWGVIIAIFTSAVFTLELAISPWFNHSDISHVLMALTAYIFYRGARRYVPEPGG